jgi:hypothetical protein
MPALLQKSTIFIFTTLLFNTSLGAESLDALHKDRYPVGLLEIFIKSGEEGVLSYFSPEMMTDQSKNRVSLAENDSQIAATFLIGNFSAKQKTYRIHCFIDYDEIPCAKDASIGVKTRSFKETHLSIQTPSSGDTTLDLLVLAIDQSGSDESIHLFHRANIIRSKSRKISGGLADNERPTSAKGIFLTPTIEKPLISALLENGVEKKVSI